MTVDINEAGEAIAAWASSSMENLFAAKFSPLTGWGGKEVVPTEDVNDHSWTLSLKMNQHGDAVLAHTRFSRKTIQVNRYESSGGWSTSEQIRGKNDASPSILTPYFDDLGQIMVLWEAADFDQLGHVELRRYLPSDGWLPVEPLYYIGKLGNPYRISNVFNIHGDGVIGWYEVLPIGYGSYDFASSELKF